MDCDNHPFMKGSISPSHQRTRGVLQPLFTCIRQSDHHHFSGHLGLKIGYPQKNPMEKKHQFSHSRSHHLTIGFNPSHVAMFAGLVWGCREVPTFRSCGWSHFFCTNFGNQRRKGIGFPTILDSSSRKWPLKKWGNWSPIWLDTPINCVV